MPASWEKVTILDESHDDTGDLNDLFRVAMGERRSTPRSNGEYRRRRNGQSTSDGYDELDFA